jgi:hypothetical protein
MTTINESSDTDGSDVLKVIISEQHRDYDYLLHIYNRMKATEGLLLTAAFGALTYLYYGSPDGAKSTIAKRLFIPAEDYGKVIYLIAAGFFLYGTIKLMLNTFGYNPWMTAYEMPKTDYQNNQEAVLQYYKKRYDECLKFNGDNYSHRKKELIFLFYCVLISAILLVVIKTLT